MFDVKSLSFYFNKIDRWTLKEEKDIRYHLLFLSKIVLKFWYFHFHLIFSKEDMVILSVKITKANLCIYMRCVNDRWTLHVTLLILLPIYLWLKNCIRSFYMYILRDLTTWRGHVKVIFCRQNKLQIYYFKVFSRCIR